jgi:hypothetical protein
MDHGHANGARKVEDIGEIDFNGQKTGGRVREGTSVGYRNRPEFIMDAIRQRIIDLKKAEILKGEANR